MRNEDRRMNKESITSDITKERTHTGTDRREKLEKTSLHKSDNTTGRNTSKDIDERKKTKKYHDRIKQYKCNGIFRNNERKFYQHDGADCTKTKQNK